MRRSTASAFRRFGLSRFGLSRFGLSRFAVWDAGLSRFVIEDMVLADIELADLDLDAIDIDPAGLSRFGLSRFGLSRFGDSLDTIVDCTKVDCNDPDATLGDAVDAGALIGNVGALILAIVNEDITELADLTFLDLFPGLFVDLTYLPWETLDLDAAHLQNQADPLEPATTFTATITVNGGPAALDVDLALPPNFVLVPDSARFDGNAIANPAQETGTLEFTRTGVASGTHTLSVQARAGLDLGEHTAHVDVAASASSLNASDSAETTVTVVESFEQGTQPKGLANNVLSVAHISSSTDEDVYEFEVTEEGTRVSMLLSGLAVDYDLILQGPPTASLRGEPTQELRPVEDNGIGLDARDEQAAPDVQYDVAVDPARGAAYSIAASRGLEPETVETGILPIGTYRATVQGYNGAFSAGAYVLQMRTTVQDLPGRDAAVVPVRGPGRRPPRRDSRRARAVEHARRPRHARAHRAPPDDRDVRLGPHRTGRRRGCRGRRRDRTPACPASSSASTRIPVSRMHTTRGTRTAVRRRLRTTSHPRSRR